jgi:hypothetical protein
MMQGLETVRKLAKEFTTNQNERSLPARSGIQLPGGFLKSQISITNE